MSLRPFQEYILERFRPDQDRLVLFNEHSKLNDQQFAQMVFGISHVLGQIEDQRIGVAIKHDFETYASIIAIWLMGKTYIPIDFCESQPSIAKKLNDLEIKTVLSSSEVQSHLPESNVLNSRSISPKINPPHRSIDRSESAYILSTSGTTGSPKYVPISYSNLDCFVDSFLNLNSGINETDRFIQFADLKFDMSIISFLIPMCIGASVCIFQEEESRSMRVAQLLRYHSITALVCPPSMATLLRPYFSELHFPELRITFFGAEELSYKLAHEWSLCAPNSQIWNLYGPSEGGIFATAHEITNTSITDGTVPVGKAVKHQHLKIQKLMNEDDAGEIWISGPQVFNGYLNSKESCFEEDAGLIWYKTGDLATTAQDGQLVFKTRLDRQIKSLGIRQNLQAMEAAIKPLVSKRNFTCTAHREGQDITLSVLKIEGDFNQEIHTQINQLPAELRPARIQFVHTLKDTE